MKADEPKLTSSQAKKKRLSAALRENMKRRKEQSRGRSDKLENAAENHLSGNSDAND